MAAVAGLLVSAFKAAFAKLAALRGAVMAIWLVEELWENAMWMYSLAERARPREKVPFKINVPPQITFVEVYDIKYDGLRYWVDFALGKPRIWPLRVAVFTPAWQKRFNLTHSQDVERVRAPSPHLPFGMTISVWWEEEAPVPVMGVVGAVPEYALQTVERHAEAETVLTAEIFAPAVDEYNINKLKEMSNEYKAAVRTLDSAYASYLRLVEEWLDDDEPTWKLEPRLKDAYEAARKALGEVLSIRRSMEEFIRSNFPWEQPPGVPHLGATPTPPSQLPERTKFRNRLLSLWADIEKAYRDILEKAEFLKLARAEYETDLASLDRMFRPKLDSLAKKIAEAEAKGDVAAAGQHRQQLEDLLEEYAARRNEIKMRLRAKYAAYINDLQTAAGRLAELARSYRWLRWGE